MVIQNNNDLKLVLAYGFAGFGAASSLYRSYHLSSSGLGRELGLEATSFLLNILCIVQPSVKTSIASFFIDLCANHRYNLLR